MDVPRLTRRQFARLAGCGSGAIWLGHACQAQTAGSSRLNVAEAERARVLHDVSQAAARPTTTLASSKSPLTVPLEFYSNSAPDEPLPSASAPPFRAHADALRAFSVTLGVLTAASLLTKEASWSVRAAEHIHAWMVDPASRMSPDTIASGAAMGAVTSSPAGVMDLVPLAEVARATSFLNDDAMGEQSFAATLAWWKAFCSFLDTARPMGIARDSKDHRASAWLLLRSAAARLLRDERALDACRRRFRAPTLRNQVRADGTFPEELATINPYRNTLMNFDLLAGVCQLLASPFDEPWSFELQDGPGMRSVAAFLYPVIRDRGTWPAVADRLHFRELPGRRPALLFAGRAFDRPEYVDLWRSLPGDVPEDLAASFPIRQPLLWTARAPHGF